MARSLSTGLLTIILFSMAGLCAAQNFNSNVSTTRQSALPNTDNKDSLIKAKLVELAINNPQVDVANTQIKIAEYGLAKAKSSWLSSLSLSSNVNEFVINNSTINGVSAASYYPKYNFGLSVPFDIVSKTKGEKNIANQNIIAAKALKEDRIRAIKTQVLTLYENYKEKKELLRLEKIITEGDNDSYVAAQKSYADGTIQLEEMNKSYQLYIAAQSKLVSSQRDFNVASIELEQLIGTSVDDAIKNATSPKPEDN